MGLIIIKCFFIFFQSLPWILENVDRKWIFSGLLNICVFLPSQSSWFIVQKRHILSFTHSTGLIKVKRCLTSLWTLSPQIRLREFKEPSLHRGPNNRNTEILPLTDFIPACGPVEESPWKVRGICGSSAQQDQVSLLVLIPSISQTTIWCVTFNVLVILMMICVHLKETSSVSGEVYRLQKTKNKKNHQHQHMTSDPWFGL